MVAMMEIVQTTSAGNPDSVLKVMNPIDVNGGTENMLKDVLCEAKTETGIFHRIEGNTADSKCKWDD